MSCELTRHADMALRAIIKQVNGLQAVPADGWNAAYRQGQIDLIRVYMQPSQELLAEAVSLVNDYVGRARQEDDARLLRQMSQAMNPGKQPN